jgi:HPt (histidine-containing phosphotransfer) domain-containing protein
LAAQNRSRIIRRRVIRGIIMALHIEQVQWMPSPPLAPHDGPIDLTHLRRMTLGDAGLEREVLAMFSAQAVGLLAELSSLPANVSELAHKMKGSARAIGAVRVAQAAEWLETGGSDAARALEALDEAVFEARSAIDGILNRC